MQRSLQQSRYCDFPSEHWTRIRTDNVIERLNCESRRRLRGVWTFPDGSSALMLVRARLRHVAGTQRGKIYEFLALLAHIVKIPALLHYKKAGIFSFKPGSLFMLCFRLLQVTFVRECI